MAGSKKLTSLLFILRILRMAISVGFVTVTAKFFGVSIEKDIWVLVSTITATITSVLWGPLTDVFRAKFVFIKEKEGVLHATNKTSSLLGFIIYFSLIVILLLSVFSKQIASQFPNIADDDYVILFQTMIIIMLPTVIINELTNIFISILNSFDVYYIPETISIFTGIASIILVFTLTPILGIYSLVLSTYVSTMFLLFILIYFLKRNHINVIRNILKPNIREAWVFIAFSLPLFFPYFINQFNALFEKYIAGSIGAGLISSLDYSRQFITILQTVLLSVLSTAMLPQLAKAFIQNDDKHYLSIFKDNFVICTLLLSVFQAFMIGAPEPLCGFFFDRGGINADELQFISSLIRAFGIAFFGVYFYIFMGIVLVSSNQNKIYASLGVVTQIIILLINAISFYIYQTLYVFPISLGVAHLLSSIGMLLSSSKLSFKNLVDVLIKLSIVIILPTGTTILLQKQILAMDYFYNLAIIAILVSVELLFMLPLVGISVRTVFKQKQL